jgi:hypothetical protein
MREPAGINPVARAAGVLVALLGTYHQEVAVSVRKSAVTRRTNETLNP